jgi:hypothetical protein
MMKRLLLSILLVSAPVFADGPRFQHKDNTVEQEFENVYHDIRSADTADPLTLSSATITSLTISNGVIPASAINGTATSDSAATGKLGEVISATTTGDAAAAATTAYDDLLSIPITAGDWDVSGSIYFSRESATWTNVDLGISNTSGNSSTGLNNGVTLIREQFVSSATTPEVVTLVLASFRISLSGTTTYYLKRRINYSAGAPISRGGRIYARRMR